MVADTQPVKVVLITGFWRSGSTILGRVLGEMNDTFDAGELAMIWKHPFINVGRCGCRLQLRECDIWQQVFQRAFGGFDAVDTRWMDEHGLQMRHLPLMLMPGGERIVRKRLGAYIDTLDRLYPSIAAVTESRVIIDASKSPPYAYMLGLVPSIDLYVIHLVRDPRGVQYSILKRKHRGDVRFQKHSVVKSTLMWNALNVSEELLRVRTGERYLRLRYEEFPRDPLGTIERIKAFIGEPDLKALDMAGDQIMLTTNHTANGSDSRFETGLIPIRTDNAWQHEMDRGERSLVTRLTSPLLWHYGYSRKVTLPSTGDSPASVGVESRRAS